MRNQNNDARPRSWADINREDGAPEVSFVPTAAQRERLQPMEQSRRIDVAWRLEDEALRRLQLGHESRDMDDKWHIVTEGDAVHCYRSWTGVEAFRLTLQKTDETYAVTQIDTQLDMDDQTVVEHVQGVLRGTLGIVVES